MAEARGLIAPSAPQLPSSASIVICLLECPELWRRTRRVGDVGGIDVRRFNAMAPPAADARSAQVWQFEHRALSAGTRWASLELADAARSLRTLHGASTLKSTRAGTCHAICAWIDFSYNLSAEAASAASAGGLEVRTGPAAAAGAPSTTPEFGATPWSQAVLFLDEPRTIASAGESVDVKLTLSLARGGALRGGLAP